MKKFKKLVAFVLSFSLMLGTFTMAQADEQDILLYTVTYDYGVGSRITDWSEHDSAAETKESPFNAGSICDGNSIVLPGAVRHGYIFDGWHDGNSIVGKAGYSYIPTDTLTLTAQYSPISLRTGDKDTKE